MPRKQTKILAISLLLLDIIFLGCFVLFFTYTKDLITKSIDGENDIKTELKMEESAIVMKDDLATGRMHNEKLMNYIVPSGGTVDFIKIIEQLVSNSGIKSDIKTVVSESYDKNNTLGIEVLRVNMDIIGKWRNVLFFIELLENYPLKIEIKKVIFNKLSDSIIRGQKITEWSGNIEFTTIKIKDSK